MGWAANLWQDPKFQELMAILKEESPEKSADLAPGASGDDVARAYGIIKGYQLCLFKIREFAEPTQEPQPEPEMTFQNE